MQLNDFISNNYRNKPISNYKNIPICGRSNLNRIELWTKVKNKYGEKVAKQIYPESYLLPNELPQALNSKYDLFVVKEKWGSLRKGLKIVKKKDLPYYQKKYDIAQVYLPNPLTLNGFKISTRLYLVAYCGIGIFLYKFGYNNYTNEKYDYNSDKFSSLIPPVNNGIVHYWQNKLPKTINEIKGVDFEKVFEILKYKLRTIIDSCDNLCCPHDEGKYNIFGIDVDLLDNYDPIIIEINSTPNLLRNSIWKNRFNRKLIRYIKKK